MSDANTQVHLVRHGEVDNPEGILYGRLPGYVLSERGRQMADCLAAHFADADIATVIASPLERARETATPIAAALGLAVGRDDRLIEAENYFEGMTFGVGDGSLKQPRHWAQLVNPFRPSWGEPYVAQARRVLAAVGDARWAAAGREAVLVSHQSPIWAVRNLLEGRHLYHDPRRRQCSLASVTTLEYDGDRLVSVGYSEPCKHLLPEHAGLPGA